MNKTSPKKEEKGAKGSGEPLAQKKNAKVEKKEEIKKEEKEEKEETRDRYVIQYNKTTEEDNYETLRKEGKVYVTSNKDKAQEIAEKLLSKHVDLTMVRICRVSNNILIPEVELTGKDIVMKNKEVLPKEMRGVISEDMLQYMDDSEISSIRNLIAEYMRKKQEIETFSRLAVQRSAFRRDKEMVKKLEEIKHNYQASKQTYEDAKKIWEEAKKETEEFIEECEKKFPSIGRWLRVEITGTGRTVRRTSGRTRTTGGKREIILKFLREHKGERFKESEIRRKLQEINKEYSWSQQSTWAPLKALREEGIISQDDKGRYYLP